MLTRIPIVDVLEELEAAGHATDPQALHDDPLAAWRLLPDARRAQLLARHGAGASGDPTAARAVRRRGAAYRERALELELSDDARAMRPWDRVLYARAKPSALAALMGSVTPPTVPFLDGRSARRRVPYVATLDAASGGDPYDVERDGALSDPPASPSERIIETYWVEEPFASVSIARGPEGELTYTISEPKLSASERHLLATLNERMRDVLVLGDERVEDQRAHVAQKVFDLLKLHRLTVGRRTSYRIGYYFLRNYLGFGRIEPIVRDDAIEDISCNGPGLPLFVVHARHHNLRVGLEFDESELDALVVKLGQSGGKLLSMAEPLVDATLPDGSRIQTSLGRAVTSRGSAFTIRKFREDPLTCVDLVKKGTHSLDSMAFLWLAVDLHRSVVVMGATASGKTTTLNCISQFIPPAYKIVTIEDTREIMLQHENWLAAVTREAIGGRGEAGEVSMYALLRAALRQRPEYILVGEIRGAEGVTLFQAMSTGHTCFSTMHAGSVESAVYRLENPPIGVPRAMLTSLDLFLLQGQVQLPDGSARRMLSLTEINGIDPASRNLRLNEIFRWDAENDRMGQVGTSSLLDEARARRGWTRSRMEEEVAARRRVLETLVDANDRHYRVVANAIRRYYTSREDSPSPAVAVPVKRQVSP